MSGAETFVVLFVAETTQEAKQERTRSQRVLSLSRRQLNHHDLLGASLTECCYHGPLLTIALLCVQLVVGRKVRRGLFAMLRQCFSVNSIRVPRSPN